MYIQESTIRNNTIQNQVYILKNLNQDLSNASHLRFVRTTEIAESSAIKCKGLVKQ